MSDRFRRLEVRPDAAAKAESEETRGATVRTAAEDLRLADASRRDGRYEEALRQYTRALGQDRALIPAWVGQVQMLVELDELLEARLWSDKALELFRNNGELLAVKSQACTRLGDRRAAMACSDASLQSPGSSAARWRARGEALLGQSPRRARDCFEKSLAEPDAEWFDRIVIARIYLWHDRATAALSHAQEAVRLEAAHAYAWFVLGRCQEALGWYEQAEDTYARCLELAPQHREASEALRDVRNRTLSQRVRGWLRGRLRR